MAIGIHPLTASIGAEITGVDLADLSDETVEELRKAWLDHKVLVLRDQHITQEQHIAFGRQFGDLEINPSPRTKRVVPRSWSWRRAATPATFVAAGWHSDVTWRAEPSMGSILRGVTVLHGGDTSFANAAAAHQRLSMTGRNGWTVSLPCTTIPACSLTAPLPKSVRPCERSTRCSSIQ